MRLSELTGKEVINLADGGRLGVIDECELEVDGETGAIQALILPPKISLFSFLGEKRSIYIPWHCVRRIGDEVIIVDLSQASERSFAMRRHTS